MIITYLLILSPFMLYRSNSARQINVKSSKLLEALDRDSTFEPAVVNHPGAVKIILDPILA